MNRCVKPSCARECDGFSCPDCGSDTTRALDAKGPAFPPIDSTDWKDIAVQLAAIDHRACSIITAADELAATIERELRCYPEEGTAIIDVGRIRRVLSAFKITRNGS